jgi:hypothetical protein
VATRHEESQLFDFLYAGQRLGTHFVLLVVAIGQSHALGRVLLA